MKRLLLAVLTLFVAALVAPLVAPLVAQSPDSVAAAIGVGAGAAVAAKVSALSAIVIGFVVKWLTTGVEFVFRRWDALPAWLKAAAASAIAAGVVVVNAFLAAKGLPSLPTTAGDAAGWAQIVAATLASWGWHSGLKAIGINPRPAA